MPKYLIAVHITIESEDDVTAIEDIGQFMSAALIGEPCPIIDYSVEECLESWDDLSPEVVEKFIPTPREPVQLSFDFEKDVNS